MSVCVGMTASVSDVCVFVCVGMTASVRDVRACVCVCAKANAGSCVTGV